MNNNGKEGKCGRLGKTRYYFFLCCENMKESFNGDQFVGKERILQRIL
jgi:hypothetical protein